MHERTVTKRVGVERWRTEREGYPLVGGLNWRHAVSELVLVEIWEVRGRICSAGKEN